MAFRRRFVEDPRIDGIWNRFIDQFAQHESVLALAEELHHIGRNGVSA